MNTPDHPRSERAIFEAALDIASAPERFAYLERACGQDPALLARVQALLGVHEGADRFLPEQPEAEATVLWPVTERPGDRIGHYKLLEQIGEGGCGVVYMAEQEEPVRRRVALKVIKLGMDTKQVIARFEAERQALALMDHPNIAKVFDAGTVSASNSQLSTLNSQLPVGRPYFVMELVRGIKITDYCDQNNLSTRQRLDLFVQVCHAIQHAHQKGIIHRDIKPSNILVTLHDGVPVPKVIDFGIAKATARQHLTDKTLFTAFEQFIGTPAYMSPEQAEMSGLDIDTRSDIYSLGVLLYELLTGQTPFDAKTLSAAGLDQMRRIIREQEPLRPSTLIRQTASAASKPGHDPLVTLRSPLSTDLDWIVMKCLEKDRTRRYETAHALAEDVQRHLRHEPVLARSPSLFYLLQKFTRKHRAPLAASTAGTVLLAGLLVTLTMYQGAARLQRAKGELPRLMQLVEAGDYRSAFALAQKIKPHLPDDPTLRDLWPRMCNEYSIRTTPAGASVWCRDSAATNQAWFYAGRSPLEKINLPKCTYRWKIEKPGFQTHEFVADDLTLEQAVPEIRLLEEGADRDMAWLAAGRTFVPTDAYRRFDTISVPAFLMDKYEVSNDQFKSFVDQGGYRNPEYWKGFRFVKGGRELSWAEAMQEFRDGTGQPGPATWQNGTYPAGQEKHPVAGVSWFEAAAYAAFAGKTLPSVHHWRHAACAGESLVIVPYSNLGVGRPGPDPVGSHPGMGHTGLYDMAGNVKEWCFNATDDTGQARYILGGSWNELSYVFTGMESRSPWDRNAENGFRCAQISPGESAAAASLFEPLGLPGWRDFSDLSGFSDEYFEALKAQYHYDRTPLRPKIETTDDTSAFWRREKITFDAAYGGDRMIAHLFLPKSGQPPYQTVIFSPGVDSVVQKDFAAQPYDHLLEYLVTSGRAVLFPIYYGTYERPAARGRVWDFPSVAETPFAYRDWTILMVKDLSRCIDYLETRSDIQSRQIGFCGVSHGAILGPVMLAVEDRIETGIFIIGGFVPLDLPMAFDIARYAERVKTPVLMVNGTEDALVPLNESAIPMHTFLRRGNPQTTHRLYPGGHGVLEGLFLKQIRGEVLAWLDRHLGPVEGGRAFTQQHNSKGREQ